MSARGLALAVAPAPPLERVPVSYNGEIRQSPAAMHVSRGTAKSSAARGIASLRQILGEES